VAEYNDFEEQVREGLQRENPPAGFADRVMQRVAGDGARKVIPMRVGKLNPWRQWAVAAALLVIIGGGVMEQRHRQEQIAGEEAREQVMTALQITSAQLQRVNERMNGQQ